MSNIEWNAHVIVDQATIKPNTLGLGWGIPDAQPGDRNYHAQIMVTLPTQATADIQKRDPNLETVSWNTRPDLSCGPDYIEADVTYLVTAKPGATGSKVAISIAKVAGHKPGPTGDILCEFEGPIGQSLTVRVKVQGSC